MRVHEGTIRPGMKIRMMGTGFGGEVQEVGIFNPKQQVVPELSVGEVGYVIAGIKDLHAAKIGDTVTEAERPTAEALPGFLDVKPMVFASIFPTETDAYEDLRDAMEKLRLNDASFTFEPESSTALGLRLSLRLPRPPPHGDRPGAPRARVQPLAHHDGAVRSLPREDDARAGARDLEPREAPRGPAHRRDARALHPRDDHHERRVPRRDPRARRGAAGHAGVARVRRHAARDPQVRAPAERGHPRLLRQAQVALARLRLLRLPARRLPARRPREARHPHQRRAGGRARVHRAPRQGAGEGPRRSWRR